GVQVVDLGQQRCGNLAERQRLATAGAPATSVLSLPATPESSGGRSAGPAWPSSRNCASARMTARGSLSRSSKCTRTHCGGWAASKSSDGPVCATQYAASAATVLPG